MSDTTITSRGISKRYHLGLTGMTSLREEIERGWKRLLHPRQKQRQASASDFWALQNVDFDIKAGEAVGLIGRNGSGKSTLLKILSRITEPTLGEAFVHGRVASLLEVGTGFHPELTGRENIYLNGTILGMRHHEIRRKFDEIVDFADVEEFLDTPVKRYSSGMRVRLAFAVAAQLESDILLIDEVLAVGDQTFQQKCLGRMKEVTTEGRTVVFVSHTMTAVTALCSRAILLDHGRVSYEGPIGEAVARYLSTHVDDNQFRPTAHRRFGDHSARIMDFQIEPEFPSTGRPLTAKFVIEVDPTKPVVDGIEAAFSVMTPEGQPALQLHSRDMGAEINLRPGRNHLEMYLDRLPLSAGRFRVDLWLGRGRTPVDWVQNALSLNVAPGGFVPGVMAQPGDFPVLGPTQWRIESGNG